MLFRLPSVFGVRGAPGLACQPKERVRHITIEQAKNILRTLPAHINLMVAWSLTTGCRLGETEGLKSNRVNFETMQAEVPTKGGGTRFVDLNAEALQAGGVVPLLQIGARDLETHGTQDLCQPAHANPADSHKMHPPRTA